MKSFGWLLLIKLNGTGRHTVAKAAKLGHVVVLTTTSTCDIGHLTQLQPEFVLNYASSIQHCAKFATAVVSAVRIYYCKIHIFLFPDRRI